MTIISYRYKQILICCRKSDVNQQSCMLLDTSDQSPVVAAVQSQDTAKNRIMCTFAWTVNLYSTMQCKNK
jgi:hypothetical protein